MKITSRFDGRTIYECYAETTRETLEQAVSSRTNLARAYLARADLADADLADAYLAGANLARANLARANLADADLADADLADANLAGANLAGTNLAGTNLAGANLAGKPILDIVQVAGIGSERRFTTAIITCDSVHVTCGCFRGSLDEFIAEIESTHGSNPKYLAQYRAAVEFIETCVTEARKGGA
jgi:hypothetical protein